MREEDAVAAKEEPRSEDAPLLLLTLPVPGAAPAPVDAAAAEPAVGSWGGWWRRRKRAPEGARKAEMNAAAGG